MKTSPVSFHSACDFLFQMKQTETDANLVSIGIPPPFDLSETLFRPGTLVGQANHCVRDHGSIRLQTPSGRIIARVFLFGNISSREKGWLE